MFFPFTITFKKELSVVSTINGKEILQKISELKKFKCVASTIDMSPTENSFTFKPNFLSHDEFHAIQKGKVSIYSTNSLLLTYTIYTLRFFLIFLVLPTILLALFGGFYKMGWVVGVYNLMIWIGTFVNQKLLFNGIVKKIQLL